MPIDPRRRHEIAIAVVAYDSANLPLPRTAVQLLAPVENVCQRSLDDIAMGGFNRKNIPASLRRLIEAGFMSRTPGSGIVPATHRLHLPPVRR